jgi:nicotinamidase-related amidase
MKTIAPRRDRLITREESLLVIIDMQEKLYPVAAEGKALLENTVRLVRFSQILHLPVIVTEQEKLGGTLQEIRSELSGTATPIVKLTFDCFGSPEFSSRVREQGRSTLILAGIEAHICVLQTAISALEDYSVHVVADAIGSRSPHNRTLAVERMRQSGVTITSTEMAIYELLRKAGTEEFKKVLPLVK